MVSWSSLVTTIWWCTNILPQKVYSRPSIFKHRLRKLLQVGVLVQKQALGFSLCSLLFTTLRSESINLSSPASVVTSWSVGTSSVHARGSRARTKLSRLTSHHRACLAACPSHGKQDVPASFWLDSNAEIITPAKSRTCISG